MTTTPESAPDLRRAIADVYLRTDPPPGASRASALMLALLRQPEEPRILEAARTLLDTVKLRQRLHEALGDALATESVLVALMLLGLRAKADAALCGAEVSIGWRRAAWALLDRLDGQSPSDVDRVFLLRLMLIAHGPDDA